MTNVRTYLKSDHKKKLKIHTFDVAIFIKVKKGKRLKRFEYKTRVSIQD